MCFVLLYAHYVLCVRLASRSYVDNKVSSAGSSINVKKAIKPVPVSVKINNNRESVLYVGTDITYSNLKKYGINIPNGAELLLKDGAANKHTYTLDGRYKFLTIDGFASSKFVREYERYSTPCNTNGDGVSTTIIDPDNYLAIVCNFDRDISTDPDNAKLTSIRMGCMRDESNFAYDKFMTYLASPTAYEESEDDADDGSVYSALRTDEEISDAMKDAVSTTKDYISENYRSKSDLDYMYGDGTRTKIATMIDIANMETGKQPLPTVAPIDTSKFLTKDDFENRMVYANSTNIKLTPGSDGSFIIDMPCSEFLAYKSFYIESTYKQNGETHQFAGMVEYFSNFGNYECYSLVGSGKADTCVSYSDINDNSKCEAKFIKETMADILLRIEKLSVPAPVEDFGDDKILSAAVVKSLIDDMQSTIIIPDPSKSIVYEDKSNISDLVVRNVDLDNMIIDEVNVIGDIGFKGYGDKSYYDIIDLNEYYKLYSSPIIYVKGTYTKNGKVEIIDSICKSGLNLGESYSYNCDEDIKELLIIRFSGEASGGSIYPYLCTSFEDPDINNPNQYYVNIEKISALTNKEFNDDKILSRRVTEYYIENNKTKIFNIDNNGNKLSNADELYILGNSNIVCDNDTVNNYIQNVERYARDSFIEGNNRTLTIRYINSNDRRKDLLVNLDMILPYPIPQYIYIRFDEIMNQLRETYKSSTVNLDYYLFSPDIKDSYNIEYEKVNTMKDNVKYCVYLENGKVEEGTSFEIDSIIYTFVNNSYYTVCLSCNSAKKTIYADHIKQYFYLGTRILMYSYIISSDCNKNAEDKCDSITISTSDNEEALIPIDREGNTKMCWMGDYEGMENVAFDLSRFVSLHMFFVGCKNLTTFSLTFRNTHQITSIEKMFSSCPNLMTADLSNIDDLSNIEDLNALFMNCRNLTSFKLPSLIDITKVTKTSAMFSNCEAIKFINLSNFYTPNLVDCKNMFDGCYNLETLDISNLDISNVPIQDSVYMFRSCSRLKTIYMTQSTFEKLKNNKQLPGYDSSPIPEWKYEGNNKYVRSDS